MKYVEYAQKMKDVPYAGIEYTMAYFASPGMVRKFPMKVTAVISTDPVVKLPGTATNPWGDTVGIVGVGEKAFSGRDYITDIILSPGVYMISPGAFAGCSGLKRIFIPRGVTRIEEKVFDGCKQLEDVYFEGTMEEWKETVIVHEKHEIEFGGFIPGTPVQKFEGERMVHITGNDPLLMANVHFRCDPDLIFDNTEEPR